MTDGIQSPRCLGVAHEDQVPPDGQGETTVVEPDDTPSCPGCAGGDAPHRGERGRLRPGHTSNPLGRPHGSKNNATLEAAAHLRDAAREAAETIVAGLKDANAWIRMGAAKTILERTVRHDLPDPADLVWLSFCTDQELEQIDAIVKRCERRRRDQGYLRGEAQTTADQRAGEPPTLDELLRLTATTPEPDDAPDAPAPEEQEPEPERPRTDVFPITGGRRDPK